MRIVDYDSEKHTLGTRGALGCIGVLTLVGMFLVWAFFKETQMPELIYDGPPITEFLEKEEPEPLPAETS